MTQKKRKIEKMTRTKAAPAAATAIIRVLVNHELIDEPPPDGVEGVFGEGLAGVPGGD